MDPNVNVAKMCILITLLLGKLSPYRSGEKPTINHKYLIMSNVSAKGA
jgi:hypothetical protein